MSHLPIIAVTGSQRPYIYDLPHLLSLPDGFEFRFRYRHRWVEDSLVSTIRTNPASLREKDLILLFHSQQTRRLIPIRKCTIINVESIGPLVFLRFRLGQFPAVDDAALMSPDSSLPEATANKLGSLGLALLGSVGDTPLDLAEALPPNAYLRSAAEIPEGLSWAVEVDAPEIGNAWARLAVCLLKEPNLATVPMFHVLGFQKENGSFAKPRATKDFSVSKQKAAGFRLVEGVRYKFRLLAWCEPPVSPLFRSLRVISAFRAELLQLYGGSDLVVGRYDIVEFTFQAMQRGYTELAIHAEPLAPPSAASKSGDPWARKQEKPLDWPAIFSVRVPIRVRMSFPRFVRALVIATTGAAVYGIVPIYLTSYPELWKGLGLFLLFAAAGDVLERFAKFGETMRKFIKAGQ